MSRLASLSSAPLNRCDKNTRRGAAAVEFAMTAPILFALVLGAVEFSRANMLVHTTAIAATEAARKSIIPGATAPEVRLKALEELRAVGIVDANVTLDPAEIVDDTTQVTVSLTVPVSLRNGYGLSRVFLGKQIFKSVTLQREGKTEDIATETVRLDGIQGSSNLTNSMPGNSGSSSGNGNGNGNGNNGNGNGNGGGNGSNGNSSGNSSSSNSGNGNSGPGSSNSGSGSSSGGSGSSGSSGGSGGGFWGALRALLGL
jgi:hypothetical protein